MKNTKTFAEWRLEYTRKEKSDMLKFARRITPPNWNIYVDFSDYKAGRRTVNVWLNFPSCKSLLTKTPDPRVFGTFGLVSEGLVIIDGSQGYQLSMHAPWKRWRPLIVHELAHIAAQRRAICSSKEHMRQRAIEDEHGVIEHRRIGLLSNCVPPAHGRTFKKALSVMRKRAQKAAD